MNFNERYQTLLDDIGLFHEMGIAPEKRLKSIVGLVTNAMDELKKEVTLNGFLDTDDEIAFFKNEKPKFYAEQIYAIEFFTMEINKPKENETVIRNYYEQELRFIKRFFDQHRFVYQYYQLGGSELDEAYFTRGAKPASIFLTDAPAFDPCFSAACDYLIARFISCERMQVELLNLLYGSVDQPFSLAEIKKKRNLKWTGDKSKLIELAYALYSSGEINNGKLKLADLMSLFEESFEVSLSRYSHRFSEIKMRKSISRTKFLDDLAKDLIRYMDEADGSFL
jgi:hypothetical protein